METEKIINQVIGFILVIVAAVTMFLTVFVGRQPIGLILSIAILYNGILKISGEK